MNVSVRTRTNPSRTHMTKHKGYGELLRCSDANKAAETWSKYYITLAPQVDDKYVSHDQIWNEASWNLLFERQVMYRRRLKNRSSNIPYIREIEEINFQANLPRMALVMIWPLSSSWRWFQDELKLSTWRCSQDELKLKMVKLTSHGNEQIYQMKDKAPCRKMRLAKTPTHDFCT